jgi:hypothetical protein
MKFPAFAILLLMLSALPLAAAQEEPSLELNMTLDDGFCPGGDCAASACPPNSACAVGYVNVTLLERPPEPPVTGLFLAQFDFQEFFSDIVDFFSELFKSASKAVYEKIFS